MTWVCFIRVVSDVIQTFANGCTFSLRISISKPGNIWWVTLVTTMKRRSFFRGLTLATAWFDPYRALPLVALFLSLLAQPLRQIRGRSTQCVITTSIYQDSN